MKKFSIGSRLTFWYVLMFAGAQLIFGLGMWFILSYHLYDIADDQLESQIDDLQHFLQAQENNVPVAKLRATIAETYVLEHSGDYLQIQDEHGDWIYRAALLAKHNWLIPDPNRLRSPLYEDRELEGQPYRFLSETLVVGGHRFVVQTGVPEDDVLDTLNTFRNYLLAFAVVMLAVASAVGYWLSRKALAPVDAITRTARTIGGTNLSSRLASLHTDDELQRLSDTLNEMLARIETSFLRVSQFTADASHELRTPISLMRTEAEIALRKPRDEAAYRDALRHILLEAEKTSALVENLLSLARADAGRDSLNMQILHLREVTANAAQNWQQVMSAHDLNLTTQLPDQDLSIAGDEAAIRRLLNILLDNAVKYTPTGGTIELRLQAIGGNAVISIADTGIGISEEDQPHIFERFYRADKARSREGGGSGLGLAIAHWIAQQHQGSIEVKSSLGSQTVFTVALPLLSNAVSNPSIIGSRTGVNTLS